MIPFVGDDFIGLGGSEDKIHFRMIYMSVSISFS
jgi:hypothetical protein